MTGKGKGREGGKEGGAVEFSKHFDMSDTFSLMPDIMLWLLLCYSYSSLIGQ